MKPRLKEGRLTRLEWPFVFGLSVLPLLGFWLYGLFDLDEGYYGAVVAEMNRRGEWITPYFNGHPWFEKPILLYWLAKPSVIVFGESVGPRLPSILATVGLFVLCGLYLRRKVSLYAGKWAVAVLGTCLIVIAMGRMMTTDAVLDLCVAGAFLSFYESMTGHRAWRLLTAFCLGLAVLAKGPVTLPLFLAVAIWTFVAEKDMRDSFKRYWLLGVVILFVTIGLWYWPAYAENGRVFIQKFLVEQNLQRFGGGDEAHRVPLFFWPIYYPAIILLGMAPWSIPLARPWYEALRGGLSSFERYLARWAFVILALFTLSGVKLPHYILPAIPPLAMLVAIRLAKGEKMNWALVSGLSVGYCLLANAVFLFWYHKGGFAEVHGYARRVNEMVNDERGVLIAYQLSRVANAPGLHLNETDSPSLAFYLHQPGVTLLEESDFSNFESTLIGALPLPNCYVLTRPGRLSDKETEDLQAAGVRLDELPLQANPPQYLLFKAVPVQSSPGR